MPFNFPALNGSMSTWLLACACFVQFLVIAVLLSARWRATPEPASDARAETDGATLFEDAMEPAYVIDPNDGRILAVNQATVRKTGYPPEVVTQLSVYDLHPETDRQTLRQFLMRTDADADAAPLATSLCGRERRKRSVYLTISESAYANAPARLVVAHDAERYHSTVEEVKALNRFRDEMLQNISHELRTPLTAILGWSELLLSDDLDPKQSSLGIHQIKSASEKLLRLIDDFLDLSKLRRGALTLETAPADINAPIRTACHNLQAAMHNKRLTVRLELATNLPTVAIDAPRIQQVMWNLLLNAIKFTDQGGVIVIRSRFFEERIEISISDTGVGIDEQTLPMIFQGYRQADGSSARRYAGAGTGLTLVKSLVELHGGEIAAVSRPGEGSVFTFRIPVVKFIPPTLSPIKDAPVAPLNEALPLESFAADAPGGARSVLVIDDDENLLKLLGAVVRAAGFDPILADGGNAGLEKAKSFIPDVILLDIGMPDLDGFETYTELRRDPRLSHVKIVALTAYANSTEKRRILEHGFDGFIGKPFKRDQLIETINQFAVSSAAP